MSHIYTNPQCLKFIKKAEKAGLEVEHYRGRFFWEGPAVRVDSLEEAREIFGKGVQHDNMGMGFIVYPISSDKGIEAEDAAPFSGESKIDKALTLENLKKDKANIQHESEDDEGAVEFEGEIDSVIAVVSDGDMSDAEIIKAAVWVGLSDRLVFLVAT